MAELTITITIPDDKVQDLLDAYNWRIGGSDGSDPDGGRIGAGEIKDRIKRNVIADVREVYMAHKHWLSKQRLEAFDLGIE